MTQLERLMIGLNQIKDSIQQIRVSIQNKGVNISDNVPLSEYPYKISTIRSGMWLDAFYTESIGLMDNVDITLLPEKIASKEIFGVVEIIDIGINKPSKEICENVSIGDNAIFNIPSPLNVERSINFLDCVAVGKEVYV